MQIFQVWSFDNALNTVSTIMQKSTILTLEWDKRFNNILYIGTKSNSVKLYDVYQKRIIQDLAFNKMYPLITLVNPLASNGYFFCLEHIEITLSIFNFLFGFVFRKSSNRYGFKTGVVK
jgi:hypothetical protein